MLTARPGKEIFWPVWKSAVETVQKSKPVPLQRNCGLPTEVAAVFATVQQFLDEVKVGRPDR